MTLALQNRYFSSTTIPTGGSHTLAITVPSGSNRAIDVIASVEGRGGRSTMLVQSVDANTTTGSWSLTLNGVAQGNKLIIQCAYYNDNGATPPTVSDSNGETWDLVNVPNATIASGGVNYNGAAVWGLTVKTPGTHVITITGRNSSVKGYATMSEWQGVDVVDVTAAESSGATTQSGTSSFATNTVDIGLNLYTLSFGSGAGVANAAITNNANATGADASILFTNNATNTNQGCQFGYISSNNLGVYAATAFSWTWTDATTTGHQALFVTLRSKNPVIGNPRLRLDPSGVNTQFKLLNIVTVRLDPVANEKQYMDDGGEHLYHFRLLEAELPSSGSYNIIFDSTNDNAGCAMGVWTWTDAMQTYSTEDYVKIVALGTACQSIHQATSANQYVIAGAVSGAASTSSTWSTYTERYDGNNGTTHTAGFADYDVAGSGQVTGTCTFATSHQCGLLSVLVRDIADSAPVKIPAYLGSYSTTDHRAILSNTTFTMYVTLIPGQGSRGLFIYLGNDNTSYTPTAVYLNFNGRLVYATSILSKHHASGGSVHLYWVREKDLPLTGTYPLTVTFASACELHMGAVLIGNIRQTLGNINSGTFTTTTTTVTLSTTISKDNSYFIAVAGDGDQNKNYTWPGKDYTLLATTTSTDAGQAASSGNGFNVALFPCAQIANTTQTMNFNSATNVNRTAMIVQEIVGAPSEIQVYGTHPETLVDGQTGVRVSGVGFGRTQGSGKVYLEDVEQTVTAWDENFITITIVRPSTVKPGLVTIKVTK